MRRTASRQPGFMLLLTLVLLTIVAVGSAHIARQSMLEATLALRAEEDLQRRWLIRSFEDVLLERAELAIAAEADAAVGATPPAEATRTLIVSGFDIELRFSDEQAKVNANVLLERLGRRAAEQRLTLLIRDAGAESRVNLQPLGGLERTLHGARADWPALAGFEQVLALPGGEHQAPALLPRVTLWGDGRVHARRAAREVLEAALAPELGSREVDRLVALRREEPDETLGQWLARMQLSRRVRESVDDRLAESSGCYALAVAIHGEQRTWRRLVVGQRLEDEHWRILHRRAW